MHEYPEKYQKKSLNLYRRRKKGGWWWSSRSSRRRREKRLRDEFLLREIEWDWKSRHSLFQASLLSLPSLFESLHLRVSCFFVVDEESQVSNLVLSDKRAASQLTKAMARGQRILLKECVFGRKRMKARWLWWSYHHRPSWRTEWLLIHLCQETNYISNWLSLHCDFFEVRKILKDDKSSFDY